MSSIISTHAKPVEEPPRRVSFDEWLAWAPDSRITEWVDGEIIEMTPIAAEHDSISRWLTALLEFYLMARPVGELRGAPSVLKLTQTRRGREPDLMFIAAEHANQLHPTFVNGPVDAVFEIVSPESVGRDRGDKFVEYEAEGIPEYWLIDPDREQLELYQLADDGRYRLVSPQEGKFESSVITGFYIRAEWLWVHPKPNGYQILREFGIL